VYSVTTRVLARALVTFVAALGCFGPVLAEADDPHAVATRIVDLLCAGDTAAVASLLHYPPGYTKEERAADETGVRKQLDVLLQRFGKISRPEPPPEIPATIDLGVSGGSLPYYQSLGKVKLLEGAYPVTSEHFGEAAIRVAFIKFDRGFEPFRVSFGIATSKPEARALADEIGRALSALSSSPPPGI